ncbi:COX4-domain-containing protein [Agrocybe pediades]|nr:COX4-domain-containing protein [Agrocybe pediades]
MQAIRLARTAVAPLRTTAQRRCLATATANPAELSRSDTATSSPSSAHKAPIPIGNIEAQWERLSNEEKLSVHEQLEVIQQKDWKELTLDEKKAAYYVAFGPHGPRTPISKPGDNLKIFLATLGLVGVSAGVFFTIQGLGGEPPKSMSKEWQEASNQIALEAKINPITGISSEGYSGKGFVQSK